MSPAAIQAYRCRDEECGLQKRARKVAEEYKNQVTKHNGTFYLDCLCVNFPFSFVNSIFNYNWCVAPQSLLSSARCFLGEWRDQLVRVNSVSVGGRSGHGSQVFLSRNFIYPGSVVQSSNLVSVVVSCLVWSAWFGLWLVFSFGLICLGWSEHWSRARAKTTTQRPFEEVVSVWSQMNRERDPTSIRPEDQVNSAGLS